MSDLNLFVTKPIMKWDNQPIVGSVPLPRAGHTCVLLPGTANPYVVLVGGYGDSIEYDDYVNIDVNSFTMNIFAPLDKSAESAARVGHASVVIGSLVYSYGGWNGKRYVNSGILYDPENSTVLLEKNKGRPMPEGRRDHSMVYSAWNKRVYLFGGWNCSDPLTEMWSMDEGWDWSVVPVSGSAPSSRRGHSACMFKSSMIVFGGLYGLSKYLNDVYVFDTQTNTWSLAMCQGESPSPRAWHTATAIGKYMVVFGGTAGRTLFYDDVYVLNTESMVWAKAVVEGSETTVSPVQSNVGLAPISEKGEEEEIGIIADSPSFRASHSAVAVDTKIYIFGGLSPIGKDYKITPQNNLWILETRLTN